jgi:hypothetical protein
MKNHKNYTTSGPVEAIKNAAAILLLIAVLTGWVLQLAAEHRAREQAIVAVIPMANQNISWSGAGYDGIYGRAD